MSKARRRLSRQKPKQPKSLPYTSCFGLGDPIARGMEDVHEVPFRSPQLASQLMDLVDNCPEAAKALEVITSYTFSSGTGDELGFVVAPDKRRPNWKLVDTANETIARVADIFTYLQIVWRLLAWGDAFASIQPNDNLTQVERLILLPSWQCFRIEDEVGQLLRYEQQWSHAERLVIESPAMIHWAYNRQFLYGRSLWFESLPDWDYLRRADVDLGTAGRTLSYRPTLHVMPTGYTAEQKKRYKADHEAKQRQGIIPDIYLDNGADVKKPQGFPDSSPLKGFIDNHDLRRLRIAMRSHVPLYLLGIQTQFAKEIAYQPALAFKLFIGICHQLFAQGIRQAIDTDLALQGFEPPYSYRVMFPTINLNPWMPMTDSDLPGDSDVEDSFARVVMR